MLYACLIKSSLYWWHKQKSKQLIFYIESDLDAIKNYHSRVQESKFLKKTFPQIKAKSKRTGVERK